MDYFDILLAKKLNGGGGGDITIEDLYVNANGEYRAPSGKAYGKVTANVPAPSNAIYKQTLSDLPSPIATFTGADAPIDSLKASIVGVQSGSGEPSPSNVRPISGWSSCDVTVMDDLTNPTYTHTYTIAFKDSSDNPITVYDGGIDISGGKLTNNSGIAVATDFIYGGTSSGGLKYFDYYPPNYTRILDKIRCSHLSYVAPAESWEMTTPCFTVNASRLRVYFADAVPNDLTMEYPFATPITMQFDPLALRSNGVTNISVNCGEVTELKYFSETP